MDASGDARGSFLRGSAAPTRVCVVGTFTYRCASIIHGVVAWEPTEGGTCFLTKNRYSPTSSSGDASLDQLEDLVQRINLALQERGMPGLVWRQTPEGGPRASDPADPGAL